MKFIVGAMLTTFGVFWGSEGVGVVWPGQDAAILAILTFVVLTALLSVRILRRRGRETRTHEQQLQESGA
jgi:uncharacterized membrane protein